MRKAILLLILTSCSTVGDDSPQPLQVRSSNRVTIINAAPNTTLFINDCNIGEIDGKLNYQDTITFVPNNFSDTIVIDGEINSSYPIYKGRIFIPFSNVVELKDGCNWRNEDGGIILKSIGFDVQVKDWQ